MSDILTILIIDDDELIRQHLRLYIESFGFDVLEADDGHTGIALFEESRPDLVLTDLRMPVMDGSKVLEHFRHEYPDIPVIVVSGTSDIQHALESIRSGAWDYIVKPVRDAEALHVVIRRTIERKRLIAENRRYQTSLEAMVKERTKELHIFSQAASQSPVSIVITDTNGQIEYVNPHFCQITGYDAEEVLRQNPRILKSEKTPPELHTQLWETISTGGVWEGVFHNKRKNGDIFLEHAIISAIRDDKGTISHYLAIKEDITEKVRLEEESNNAQAKLIQADKLSSLGLLVSGIAHEINNPNNFILRNSELLADAWHAAMPILAAYYRDHGDFYLGDFQFSEAEEILPRLFSGLTDGSRRIRSIVERLRNFSRQDAGSTNDCFDVNKVIFDAISILNHEIKKLCEPFHFTADPGLPLARGNAQQIEQVVINLIMNGLQALADKHHGIRISTCRADDGDHIAIMIADEGCGMTPEVLRRLSEPFFTTKGETGGTGLGLYICSSILRDNHGSLTFQSVAGTGTTATVLLKTCT